MHKQNEKQLEGVLGFFDDPTTLMHAAEKLRDKGEKFDAFTPFPVHGLEKAQGLKRSPLPFFTLGAGLTGVVCGFLLQYWTSVVDWPLIIGGKPYNSWPAFVPIMFECTILFAGLTTVGAMFAINGLPNIKRKSFDPSLTRDRFAILIEPRTVKLTDEEEEAGKSPLVLDTAKAEDSLKQVGAKEVRVVYAEGWFDT